MPSEAHDDIGLATAGRYLALRLPSACRTVLKSATYRPFLRPATYASARLHLHEVSQHELAPDLASLAAKHGYPFEHFPVMNYPTVAERYLARTSEDLCLPYPTSVHFLRTADWTMESYAFPRLDIAGYVRGRIFCFLGSLLAATDGTLLHGSGFVVDGRAAAVIGPSDAGKTTAAKLVAGDHLLSDDVVAVTDIDGEPHLHATPLGRESDGIASAPLRAIFFPRKHTSFALQPVPARQALLRSAEEQADGFANLFPPYGGMAIRNLARLFRKVPAYELGFSLDGIDREAIRRVLSGS